MNQKIKAVLVALLAVTVLVLAGCSSEQTPYQRNDADSYNVSVKFDANGGFFATNTSVIVDSYDISTMENDGSGNVKLALLAPDNAVRGIDAYTATNPDHFLAGWYAQRSGEPGSYTYAQKWNFETDRLSVKTGENYSAEDPVLTLYAVWVPMFNIEFYDLQSGELLNTMTFNPLEGQEFQLPHWDEETGAIEMYKLPAREGYTYKAAYYDAEGTQPVGEETLLHPGFVDEATGVAQNPTMKVYTDWMEGEWYQIYTAEQFLNNASVSGNYEIHADLDFEGQIWPTSLMHGNFSGTIRGNGHSFRNITVEQTNNSKINTGLFGTLTETANISDIPFQNVQLTVKAGTRVAGASFGVLCGAVSDKAALAGVTFADSRLSIDANAYFGTADYAMGLVSGMGNTGIDHSGIRAEVIGEDAAIWAAAQEDGSVTLTDTPPAEDLLPAETLPEETVPAETTLEENPPPREDDL